MGLSHLQEMLYNFKSDRKTMEANNTPQKLVELTKRELVEVSEVLHDPDKLKTEIADCMILLLTLAGDYGFDMEAEIREKVAANIVRYEARYFQDGDYDESRKFVKSIEKPILEQFYSI